MYFHRWRGLQYKIQLHLADDQEDCPLQQAVWIHHLRGTHTLNIQVEEREERASEPPWLFLPLFGNLKSLTMTSMFNLMDLYCLRNVFWLSPTSNLQIWLLPKPFAPLLLGMRGPSELSSFRFPSLSFLSTFPINVLHPSLSISIQVSIMAPACLL